MIKDVHWLNPQKTEWQWLFQQPNKNEINPERGADCHENGPFPALRPCPSHQKHDQEKEREQITQPLKEKSAEKKDDHRINSLFPSRQQQWRGVSPRNTGGEDAPGNQDDGKQNQNQAQDQRQGTGAG